jgi:hypothetical protein
MPGPFLFREIDLPFFRVIGLDLRRSVWSDDAYRQLIRSTSPTPNDRPVSGGWSSAWTIQVLAPATRGTPGDSSPNDPMIGC